MSIVCGKMLYAALKKMVAVHKYDGGIKVNERIGFLGAGNMGSALIRGIVDRGQLVAGNLFVYDIDENKPVSLSREYGVTECKSSEEVFKKSDMIFVAVKPFHIKQALTGADRFLAGKTVISVAAGISIQYIKALAGEKSRVVRAMPNTPALVGEGMTAVSFEKGCTDEERERIVEIFKYVGRVEVMEESLMNDVIALSGSSPAYAFVFIEAMADAAVRSGIKRDIAYRMAAQSLLGASKMVLETGNHPAVLKDMVCSPAGTTIEAVASLEKNGFRNAVIEAMQVCSDKARKLQG